MPVEIGSTGEWDRALSSNAVVVADFHATWCGPCKMIAPTFESLSTKYAKPGKIAFCKIDVDAQRDIASRYSVRSMPTFIIFRSGSEHKRIAGADPGKLTNEVSEAVKLAGAAAAPSFSTPGRALGVSSGQKLGSGGRRGGGGWSIPSPTKFLNALITFFGLYFASLITFDPYKAAENSQFNVNRRDAPQPPIRGSGQKVGSTAPPRPSGGVRTLKDLGGS